MPSSRVLGRGDRGDKARTIGRQTIGSERCPGAPWNAETKKSEIFRVSHESFYAVDRCVTRTYMCTRARILHFHREKMTRFLCEAYCQYFRFARISRAPYFYSRKFSSVLRVSYRFFPSPSFYYVVYLSLKSPFENGCHFGCRCIDRYNFECLARSA